ncbi:DUF930 domain-containing protein [Martelella radicis]|uniref:DUF930 domain-containing protein n=1 Tax=Martelella radicis TaxID=1397476 RepID=A0A7W6PAA9_9HYPH|nr:hypothetical protein [Martelella radicis]
MFRTVLVAACVVLAGSQAFALNKRIAAELERLDPEEELEQRCDVEALSRIDAARRDMTPDKVIAYTFAPPEVKGNTIDADGAVFRSRGHWYHLRYHCVTDASELAVTDFSFRIGKEIPRSEWDRNYLYP